MAIFRNVCVRLIPQGGTQNTKCISAVNPATSGIAFLDLAKIPSFSDSLRRASYYLSIYRLSHIQFHRVIGRRRITIQPPPSGLVKFNM